MGASGRIPPREAPNFASGWDPDGFRAGVADMQGVSMTIETIGQAAEAGGSSQRSAASSDSRARRS
jgi:hypothetical protein